MKQTLTKLLIAFILTGFALPPAALAKENNACVAIADRWEKYLEDKEAWLSTAQNERESLLAIARGEVEREVKDQQNEARNRRDAKLEALKKVALTWSQKRAINIFNNSVERSLNERKAAIVAANKEFRRQVDQYFATNKTKRQGHFASFKKVSVEKINKARGFCRQGGDKQLDSELKTAENALRAQVQALYATTTIMTIISNRNAALDRAQQQFEGKLQAAELKLKADIKKAP